MEMKKKIFFQYWNEEKNEIMYKEYNKNDFNDIKKLEFNETVYLPNDVVLMYMRPWEDEFKKSKNFFDKFNNKEPKELKEREKLREFQDTSIHEEISEIYPNYQDLEEDSNEHYNMKIKMSILEGAMYFKDKTSNISKKFLKTNNFQFRYFHHTKPYFEYKCRNPFFDEIIIETINKNINKNDYNDNDYNEIVSQIMSYQPHINRENTKSINNIKKRLEIEFENYKPNGNKFYLIEHYKNSGKYEKDKIEKRYSENFGYDSVKQELKNMNKNYKHLKEEYLSTKNNNDISVGM